MPLNIYQERGWRQRWILSYVFDYVIVIVLIIGFSALDLADPHHQPFSLDNDSLKYPYADPERISAAWAGIISCLFPMCCIAAWTMLVDGRYSHHKPPTNRQGIMSGPWAISDRLWEMNCGILGLGLSVAGSICATGALKNTTGKPRPDIIARCKPIKGLVNPPYGLVTSAICHPDTPSILRDGFKSWPSGHASIAFAGLGYLSLFLAGKLHIMDNRGEVWKTVIVTIPLLAAALVSVSRIMDARHHPFDVITGAALGLLTSWVSYRQYFPSISNYAAKGRAYSRRTWGTNAPDAAAMERYPLRDRDVEEGAGPGVGSSSNDSLDNLAARKRPALSMPLGRSFTGSSATPLHPHEDNRISMDVGEQSRGSAPPGPEVGRLGSPPPPPPLPATAGVRRI